MNISISRNGMEIGQWPENEVLSLYGEGSLLETDYFWREGMEEWKPLLDLVKPPTARLVVNKTISPAIEIPSIKTKKDWNWSNPLYWISAIVTIVIAKTVVGPLIGTGAFLYPDIAMPMLAGGFIGFLLCLIPASLAHFYYKVKNSDRYVWLPIVAGIILGLMFGLLHPPDDINHQLFEASDKMNRTLPKMVTEFIRIDSTTIGSDRTWHYHYTLLRSKPGLDSTQLNTILKAGILKEYRTNPDLKFFRDNQIILDHDYYDIAGNFIGTVEASPKDLE